MKLLVFSLGLKGLSVVKGLCESAAKPSIFCVEVDPEFRTEV